MPEVGPDPNRSRTNLRDAPVQAVLPNDPHDWEISHRDVWVPVTVRTQHHTGDHSLGASQLVMFDAVHHTTRVKIVTEIAKAAKIEMNTLAGRVLTRDAMSTRIIGIAL